MKKISELYPKFRSQKCKYLCVNPIAFALYLKEISVKGTQTTEEILSHSHIISVIHKIGPRSEQTPIFTPYMVEKFEKWQPS